MKPLSGITILDISRLLPGGYASLLLREQGARVIKVEQPGVGDYYRALVQKGDGLLGGYHAAVINQGKESLGLDLKSDEGRRIFLKLVRRCDVVLESFRPGTLKKLGIDYARLKRLHPSIILCSITGFGQKGPRSRLAGHDLNFLGVSGLLARNRDEHGQTVIPDFQVVDLASGLEAAMRIAAALVSRRKTRRGAWIDVGMSGVGISLSRLYASFPGVRQPYRKSMVGGGLSRYGVYRTLDNREVTLGALEPKFWSRFCRLTGHPEWEGGSFDFSHDSEGMREVLSAVFRSKTLAAWVALGEREDLCLFPVEEIDDLTLPAKKKTPRLGQDTARLLRSLGYDRSRIKVLKEQGVIQ